MSIILWEGVELSITELYFRMINHIIPSCNVSDLVRNGVSSDGIELYPSSSGSTRR